MLKVNTEKLLKAFHELDSKIKERQSSAEAAAREFAAARGYNDKDTESLVQFVQELESFGDMDNEYIEYCTMKDFIEEVDEPIADSDDDTGTVSEMEIVQTDNDEIASAREDDDAEADNGAVVY